MPAARKSDGARGRKGAKPAGRSAGTAKPVTPASGAPALSPEARNDLIREAAYFLAEADGFREDARTYWLMAEARIDGKAGA